MENKNKVILDLAGGTGSWSKPYRKAGYQVYVITLPGYDLTRTNFCDGFIVFQGGTKTALCIRYDSVYGILFASPCTQFSIARNDKTAKTPRDFRAGLVLVDVGMKIIRECKIAGPALKFWALENPRGYLRHFLGKPVMTFNPYDFGDAYGKNTDLWGFFNFPKKKPVVPVVKDAIKYTLKLEGIMPQIPKGYNIPKGVRPRTVRRSITPPGFAEAFYRANK